MNYAKLFNSLHPGFFEEENIRTLPEFRRRGIGLEMVRLATQTLKQDGFDLSWIHYTHLADWYSRLGYQPVLRWNSGGLLADK